ncbi:hypothetical protein Leryth_002094, partial [Lithospermum erythrorhizon]
ASQKLDIRTTSQAKYSPSTYSLSAICILPFPNFYLNSTTY